MSAIEIDEDCDVIMLSDQESDDENESNDGKYRICVCLTYDTLNVPSFYDGINLFLVLT